MPDVNGQFFISDRLGQCRQNGILLGRHWMLGLVVPSLHAIEVKVRNKSFTVQKASLLTWLQRRLLWAGYLTKKTTACLPAATGAAHMLIRSLATFNGSVENSASGARQEV